MKRKAQMESIQNITDNEFIRAVKTSDIAQMHKYFQYRTMIMQNGLLNAVLSGQTKSVEYLIKTGINIHFRNDISLGFALTKGHLEIARLLINAGAKFENITVSQIQQIVLSGNLDTIGFIVDLGLNHNQLSELISAACSFNEPKILLYLLDCSKESERILASFGDRAWPEAIERAISDRMLSKRTLLPFQETFVPAFTESDEDSNCDCEKCLDQALKIADEE